MAVKYNDYPFHDCAKAADKLIGEGAKVFQKFTCVGCGQRLTIDVANVFHTSGACDKCDAVTDIARQGCNYMVIHG
jgi:hypothetical protein